MKDCVQRRKSEVDNKQRQVIDSKKLLDAPYDCEPSVVEQLNQILQERITEQTKVLNDTANLPETENAQN